MDVIFFFFDSWRLYEERLQHMIWTGDIVRSAMTIRDLKRRFIFRCFSFFHEIVLISIYEKLFRYDFKFVSFPNDLTVLQTSLTFWFRYESSRARNTTNTCSSSHDSHFLDSFNLTLNRFIQDDVTRSQMIKDPLISMIYKWLFVFRSSDFLIHFKCHP